VKVFANVRQKGMARGAEKKMAKALGFDYADVRDFVAHLELDATCSQELLFLREMHKVIVNGGKIEVCPKGGGPSTMTWKEAAE
jgi:hypothetical protein